MSEHTDWFPIVTLAPIASQIALVIGVAWMLERLLARRPAASRHAVWSVALLMTFVAPAIQAVIGRAGIILATMPAPALADRTPTIQLDEPVGRLRSKGTLVAASLPASLDQPGHSTAGLPRQDEPDLGDTRLDVSRVATTHFDGPPRHTLGGAIALAWLIGMIALAVRFAWGLVGLAELRRSSRPIGVDELGRIPELVRSALGLTRLPRIAISSRIGVPLATGIVRPMVILPESLVRAVPADGLRDILIHECAHILRRDPVFGLIQRFVELIYWPHPLVYLLNHRLSRTREEACDDLVLAHADPIGYARTLLGLAERYEVARRPWAALALSGPAWKLEDRIAGLLDPARKVAVRASLGMSLATASILLVAGGAAAGVRWEGSPVPNRAPALSPDALADDPGAPGRPIPGIVVDEAGRPVGGASVRWTRDWPAPEGAITGANGRFVIRDRGSYLRLEEELVAFSESGRRQGMVKYRQSRDSSHPPAPVRIVLKPSRAVSVVVHDPAGKPIPDAQIEMIAEDGSIASGKTGADGRLTLRYPDGPKVQWIVALKPGAGFDYFENYRSWPSMGSKAVPDAVLLILNGARTAHLKAVDSKGQPLAGLEFYAWTVKKRSKMAYANLGGGRIGRSRTDQGGIATFDWLPADAEESTAVSPLPGEYHAPVRTSFTPDPQPPDRTVRLVRQVTLRGKVLRPDGRPASGILIEAAGVGKTFDDDYHRYYALTASDGTYSVAVAPDHSYIVAVIDRSMAARSQNGIVVRQEGETRDVPDLKLNEGTLLRGRVTLGADRQPLAATWISLTQHGDPLPVDFNRQTGNEERRHEGLDTDAEGRYAFRIGPGKYVLNPPDDAKGETLVVDTQEEIVRDFHLESLNGVQDHHLRGQVHDLTSGKRVAVAGALVTAFGSRGVPVEGRADASGRFELSIWYDPSFLYARNPDGTRAAFLKLKLGEGLALIHLEQAGRVTGRITDRDGKPLAGWTVWLRMRDKAESRAMSWFHGRTVTDDRGRYEFAGLVVGSEYAVSAPSSRDPSSGGVKVTDFAVPDATPVVLKDLVIAPAPPEVNPRVRRSPDR